MKKRTSELIILAAMLVSIHQFKGLGHTYDLYRPIYGHDQLKNLRVEVKMDRASPDKTKESYVIPDDAELQKRLTPLQFRVTRRDGTEPPFENKYWNNHEEGIYVDIVSGEPLFSSTDKFDSGTGWPSFTRPLEPENIVEKTDRSFLWCEPKFAASTRTHTWAMCSTMGPKLRDCGTLLIPLRYGLSPGRTWKGKGMGNTRTFLRQNRRTTYSFISME
jgi:methionine-R-sulfoxide reductase